MIKIVSNTTCGNSPKMAFLKAFSIALAKGDVEYLTEKITNDFVWNIISYQEIKGKKNLIKALEIKNIEIVSELILDQILTHGKEGAVNGTIKLKSGKQYAFSNFFKFENAKGTTLKSLTSMVIET